MLRLQLGHVHMCVIAVAYADTYMWGQKTAVTSAYFGVIIQETITVSFLLSFFFRIFLS